MDFLCPFLSTAVTAVTVIAYKTVALTFGSCQLATLATVCFCKASVLLNNLTSLISLLRLLSCVLLTEKVKNKYSMSGHTVQEGAV